MNPMTYLASSTCLFLLIPVSLSAELHCSKISEKGRFFTLSVNRKVDQDSGDWIRTYSVQNTDSEKPSPDVVLEATHSDVECNGKNVVRLEVVVREMESGHSTNGQGSSRRKLEPLIFHPRHGKNAVILDEGRSAQKLELDDPHNAVVFTNRPLNTNELFEVRLEKRITKSNHCLGIGVMTHSPENVTILGQMYTHSNGTWMYHNSQIYQSSRSIVSKYGQNINSLQVRERVGMMRRDSGDLHFFVNGVDQGRAASNIPEIVYGIVELWNDAVKVKIIY